MINRNEAMVKALAFAKRGYPVLPLHGITKREGKFCCTCGDALCTSPGKHPFPRFAPNGKDSATTDRETIKSWFATHDWLNYGVCTDPFTVIDVDPRNGGAEAWLKLVRENHDIHTWRVATGGGGQHIICAAATPPLQSGKIVRGVDVKAVGGYIVGVGCLHSSGGRYRWFLDCRPGEVDLKATPQWVIDKFSLPKKSNGEPHSKPRAREFYNTLLEPALPGERHDRVASLIGHLFGTVFPDRALLLALVISHVRLTYPDLDGFDDNEIIEIARGIAKCERKKREVA